jgi:hypothetical protein
VGFKLEVFGAVVTPGRETWEAFWEGGPRKSEGGGSLSSFARVLGDCDILTCCRMNVVAMPLSAVEAVGS